MQLIDNFFESYVYLFTYEFKSFEYVPNDLYLIIPSDYQKKRLNFYIEAGARLFMIEFG